MRNRIIRSRLRTEIRKVMQSSSAEQAVTMLPKAYSVIDKAAKSGLVHKNFASNKKAKLSNYVNKLAQSA